MRFSVPTIYANALHTARQLGIPYEVLPYTSMNEALYDPLIVPYQPAVLTRGMEVVDDYDPDIDVSQYTSAFYCIGNGGHGVVQGSSGGVPTITPIAHKATDACLYHLLPFVIKPVDNDLTTLERQKYRLRKTMLISGTLYAAYFARALDLSVATADMTVTYTQAGNPVTVPFIPTVNNLRATPPNPGVPDTGDFAKVIAAVDAILTPDEITLFIEAIQLLYGDPSLAIISEIAYVHGVDKDVTAKYPNDGAQVSVPVAANTYKEIVGAQVSCFFSRFVLASDATEGSSFRMYVGASEPLYGVVTL